VRVQHLQVATGERIVSFEIHVIAGAFRGFSNLPLGWRLEIDNDSSWQTGFKGTIDVGAASLTPQEFEKLRFLIEKAKFEIPKFHLSGTVSVTKDFETTTKIPLQMSDFVLAPAQ
jgi:hypothetical protein